MLDKNTWYHKTVCKKHSIEATTEKCKYKREVYMIP